MYLTAKARLDIAATLAPMTALFFLNHMEQAQPRLAQATQCRISRQRLIASIRACAEGGMVAMLVDSTDCDHYRSTTVRMVEATTAAVDAYLDNLYAWAEGRVSWEIVAPSTLDSIELPDARDYAAEAFEDGHPHFVFA